jgi:hypothetical protein
LHSQIYGNVCPVKGLTAIEKAAAQARVTR